MALKKASNTTNFKTFTNEISFFSWGFPLFDELAKMAIFPRIFHVHLVILEIEKKNYIF